MNRFLYINLRDGEEPTLHANEEEITKQLGADLDPYDRYADDFADQVRIYEAVGNLFVERHIKREVTYHFVIPTP